MRFRFATRRFRNGKAKVARRHLWFRRTCAWLPIRLDQRFAGRRRGRLRRRDDGRMTYFIGLMLDQGIVFASDSRTNAGMDNIAKFCKMTLFERRGDRVVVLLSSGHLD